MRLSISAVSAGLLACTAPAGLFAQTTTPPDPAGAQANGAAASDDIVVTARRTAEKLQDVPVAVTALTGAAIENRSMRTLTDIQALTPSLNFTSTNAQGSKAAVSLRGQRQPSTGIGVDPSVGVYVNEMYMARAGIDTSLYDLESIQVLKGPQGTLFGRNTTGGAILVSTKKPGDYFGGFLRAQLEDPYAYTVEGAINVPLGEDNGLRVAGTRQYRRGYTRIVNLGMRSDNRDRYGGRATLSLKSGALKTMFVGDYYRWHENGTSVFPLTRVLGVNGNGTTAPIYAALDAALAAQNAAGYTGDRRSTSTIRPFSEGRIYSALNVTTYDLTDTIVLKNIIGYSATRAADIVDYDGTSVPLLLTNVTSSQHQFSEEAQAQGKSFGGVLDWIVGGYYFRESGWDDGLSSTFVDPAVSLVRQNNHFEAVNSARSAFAHASYLLPIDLPVHVFGGARIGRDTRRMSFQTKAISATGAITCSVAGAPATLGVPGGVCALPVSKTFSSTTWDVGIDAKPFRDLLLYGSIARGYRTGGFNGRATSVFTQIPFDPETILNYEAGIKFSGFVGDVRTTLNLAAYHSLYNDIQQNIIFPNPTGVGISSGVINAAKGRINGLEVELSIRPIQSLTLSGFYSLTDAKYTRFEQLGVDISDNDFAGVPRDTGGAAVMWDAIDNDDLGKLQFNLSFRFSDGYQLDPINVAGSYIKSYSIWNTSVRLERAFGTPATLEIYAKNLFDKTYGTGGFSTASLGFASRTLGDPRVVGLGVRLPFGGE